LTGVGVALIVLGLSLPALFGFTDYFWGQAPAGTLSRSSQGAAAMASPLWSWLAMAFGLTLILGCGISAEPSRGLVWPLVLLSLLFVLQSAGLVAIFHPPVAGASTLQERWSLVVSWVALPLLAFLPIAEALTERLYFRRDEEGRPQTSCASG
jgi:hypothetical protein